MQSQANPQSLNRYSYVFNNPLKYIDPMGHDQIITTRETDYGETLYDIADGMGRYLGTATSIDELALKMKDCESSCQNETLRTIVASHA